MTREEAIARIKDHMIAHEIKEPRAIYISEALDMAIKALEQDTRQVAKWVNNIHDLPICSACGNYAVFDHAIDDYYYSDYCPKCGAKMENADKESEEE